MSSENICIINAESGIGTASPQISQFSHNCSAIEFVVNRDLSAYAVVVITSAEGKVSALSEGDYLTKTYNAQNGETVLRWYPQKEITARSGCVIYQIAAYSTDEDNKVIWYSKEGRLIVNDSIDTTDLSAELIGSSPNLVMEILTLAKTVEANLTKATDDIEANKAKISANEENIALNAGNISGLGEDFNSYKNQVHAGETTYDPSSVKAQSGKAVAEAIAAIVDSAPDTLNTLEELAAALGDDPNFATTIMTLLGGKVDKVEGKGLSANDYTDADKAMVTNADSMVMEHDEKIRVMGDSLAQLDVDAGLLGDEIESHCADRSNPHFVTKAQVGLGNADNTSDMDKPVSIATQVALDGKVDKVEGKGLSTLDFTQEEKDTITNNKNFVQILNSTMTIQHSQFRDNLANLSEKVTEVEGTSTSAIGLAEANQADIIGIKNTISDINPAPITTIPSTLEANKQYNFGEVTELSVAFPTVANDGEVIYLTFYSGAVATTLSVDTTNTCDIEVVPEVNTGYEIFGKYNGSIWIVNYSEYTVSEG